MLLTLNKGNALQSLLESDFNRYFQVSTENPMVGVAARVQLLQSVGRSLLDLPDIFGAEGRPGNLVGKSELYFSP